MKKIFFLILCVVATLQLSARKIVGKIVFEDKTITTTLRIPIMAIPHTPNLEELQRRVRYRGEKGRWKTLRPKQAKAFYFSWKGQEFRMVSHTNLPFRLKSLGGKHIFLKLESDGPLKLFTYFDNDSNQAANSAVNENNQLITPDNLFYDYDQSIHLVLQKEDGSLKCPKNIGFRKDMLGYLNGCPVVTDQIESKTLRRRHLQEIVELYNQNCG